MTTAHVFHFLFFHRTIVRVVSFRLHVLVQCTVFSYIWFRWRFVPPSGPRRKANTERQRKWSLADVANEKSEINLHNFIFFSLVSSGAKMPHCRHSTKQTRNATAPTYTIIHVQHGISHSTFLQNILHIESHRAYSVLYALQFINGAPSVGFWFSATKKHV